MNRKPKNYIGYHGTLLSNVPKIRTLGFTFKPRDNHWLGHGVYFYKELKFAQIWAASQANRANSPPAVIKANIDCHDAFVLDLNAYDDIARFELMRNEVEKELVARNAKYRNMDEHQIQCFLCDLIKERYDVDVIVRVFKKSRYRNSNLPRNPLFDYLETQICVSPPCVNRIRVTAIVEE